MFKSRNWFALVIGILFILTGLLMMANPLWNMAILGWFFSISVFVDGIFGIADYVATDKRYRSGWSLALAIVTVILGISLLGDTFIEQAALVPMLLAFWMIFIGAMRIALGFKEARIIGTTATGLLFISGIALILLGFVTLAYPWFSGAVLIYVLAFAFLVFGVTRIVEFFTTRKPATVRTHRTR